MSADGQKRAMRPCCHVQVNGTDHLVDVRDQGSQYACRIRIEGDRDGVISIFGSLEDLLCLGRKMVGAVMDAMGIYEDEEV